MIPITLSNEMRYKLKDPGTRAAWMSENAALGPDDCKNCGGVGFLYLFVATSGPFHAPPSSGIGKWDEAIQKWWVGQTHSYPCPVCQVKPAAEPDVPADYSDR
jgi:hypothetical protein